MMDCSVRTVHVGGCALLAVCAVSVFVPARSPRVSVATAFLSRSTFCGSRHKVTFRMLVGAGGFQKRINVLHQQVCSFCNAKAVFAQAIVFVTKAFVNVMVVMN